MMLFLLNQSVISQRVINPFLCRVARTGERKAANSAVCAHLCHCIFDRHRVYVAEKHVTQAEIPKLESGCIICISVECRRHYIMGRLRHYVRENGNCSFSSEQGKGSTLVVVAAVYIQFVTAKHKCFHQCGKVSVSFFCCHNIFNLAESFVGFGFYVHSRS